MSLSELKTLPSTPTQCTASEDRALHTGLGQSSQNSQNHGQLLLWTRAGSVGVR